MSTTATKLKTGLPGAWAIPVAKLLRSVGVTAEDFADLIHRRIPGFTEGGFHTHGLSVREMEIFGLMGSGHRNRPIAERLGISPKTLDIHRTNIARKLGCASTMIPRAWVLYQLALLGGSPQ